MAVLAPWHSRRRGSRTRKTTKKNGQKRGDNTGLRTNSGFLLGAMFSAERTQGNESCDPSVGFLPNERFSLPKLRWRTASNGKMVLWLCPPHNLVKGGYGRLCSRGHRACGRNRSGPRMTYKNIHKVGVGG